MRRRNREKKRDKVQPSGQSLHAEPAAIDRLGRDAHIENLYLGGHVFLVLGGPSLKDLDLSALDDRGCVKFGVNNVAATIRCQLWTYGDTTFKFHDAIWKDPGVLKLCPWPKLNNRLRTKEGGKFRDLDLTPRKCPNVVGIKRNSIFNPEAWLTESTINWGNGKKGTESKSGFPRVLSSMIQAIRLCYYLGFRYVYLLGCDFNMSPGSVYSFDQGKHDGAISSNNNAYRNLSILLTALRPKFEVAKFHVYNTNPHSGLRVFDFVPFDEAVRAAKHGMPQHIDTADWYIKGEKK